MDCNRFQQACRQARESLRGQNGIGTIGEKTLHAALKAYYEPDAESHEIKIGRYIADIVGENGIIEIQTQSFDKLRKKTGGFFIRYPCFRGLSRGSCEKTLMD